MGCVRVEELIFGQDGRLNDGSKPVGWSTREERFGKRGVGLRLEAGRTGVWWRYKEWSK